MIMKEEMLSTDLITIFNSPGIYPRYRDSIILSFFYPVKEKIRTLRIFYSLRVRNDERGDLRERELVKAFLEGDMRSFDSLVTGYRDMIFNLCYNIMGDYDEAGDCSQDVFIKMYRNLHRFEFRSSLSTWLYAIAVNTCRNRLSSSYMRRVTPCGDSGGAGFAHREADDPAVSFEASEEEKAVRSAVSKLPEEERILVVLRDFEGRDYAEISAITGVKEGTIKSRMSRARHRLRGLLGEALP